MDGIGILYAISDSNALTFPVIFDKNRYPEKLKNVNIGNLFTINNKIYVLTCLHCVKNTMEQFIIIGGTHYKCKVKFISDELELACLEVINFGDRPDKIFTILDLDNDLSKVGSKVNVQTYNIDDFCGTNELNEMVLEAKIVELIDSNLDKLKSINIPIIPRYALKLDKKFNDICELSGLSGSLILNREEKIIGIVSGIENSLINVVPACIIWRFLNEIKLSHSFSGLCSLVGKFTQCDFTKENSTENIYGYFVDHTYDINYNNYKYKLSNQIGMNLKKGDIIIEINNIKMNDKWKIFDNKLNYGIDFRTYIALNFMCGDKIPLKIMRYKKNDPTDYDEKKIFILSRPLNSMRFIPISFNNNIITIDGFTFIELSEDIINTYMNMGVYIGKSFAEYYIINPYRNDNEYIIILLDVDKSSVDKTILEHINEFGLPLINLRNNEYSMATITRVNKKKILNLDELKNILSSTNNITFQMSIDNSKKIKLMITNNKINTLKLDI